METSKLKTKVMTVTPTLAARWLERNSKNRTVRTTHVDALARDIEAGRWQFNGDTIKIGKSGNLIDGQHRLQAVVKSGKPIISVVAFDVDDAAMVTIDQGVKRAVGDMLEILDGKKYGKEKASTCRVIAALMPDPAGKPTGLNRSSTSQELLEIAKLYADDLDAIIERRTTSRKFKLNAVVSALLVIARRHAPEKVDELARVLVDGDGLRRGRPAHALREFLVHSRGVERTELFRRAATGIIADLEERRLERLSPRGEDAERFRLWARSAVLGEVPIRESEVYLSSLDQPKRRQTRAALMPPPIVASPRQPFGRTIDAVAIRTK